MSVAAPALRVHYAGESARNGRVVRLHQAEPARGDVLLRALADANVDLRIVAPFYYDSELEGWAPLRPESAACEPAACCSWCATREAPGRGMYRRRTG